MSILRALIAGLSRVLASPMLILGVYAVSLVLALPLAFAMRGILEDSIGGSRVDEKLTAGFDMQWYGEFEAGSKGLAETFGPSVTGILPQMGNWEKLLDGEILSVQGPILLAGLAFLFAWAFLGGGILDRYAQHMGAASQEQFFQRCGEFFFRFVRLQVITLFFYWLIIRWVGTPLFRWVVDSNRDTVQETKIIVHTFSAYALVAFLLIIISMASDYAKIAMVTDRWQSALLVFVRGLGFVFSRLPWTLGLYLVLLAVGGMLFLLYSVMAPGAGQSDWVGVVVAFLISQAYLLARLTLKLWFLASQTVLFTSQERRFAL